MGIFAWSLVILLRQKNAWRAFATKNNLEIGQSKYLSSPLINGLYKGNPFILYSEEQQTGDIKGKRYRTIIQFLLPPMACYGIVASPEATSFAATLNMKEGISLPAETFNPASVVFCNDKEKLLPYFTADRVKALNALMNIPNFAIVFIFDEKEAFLRFETADPLDNAERLDKLVAKIAQYVPHLKTA
jgi:hypothetical protein